MPALSANLYCLHVLWNEIVRLFANHSKYIVKQHTHLSKEKVNSNQNLHPKLFSGVIFHVVLNDKIHFAQSVSFKKTHRLKVSINSEFDLSLKIS